MKEVYHRNGTADSTLRLGVRAPCYACSAPVAPWLCELCVEIDDGSLVTLACQTCHVHGSMPHVGFAGGWPNVNWATDEAANGWCQNAVRAMEDGAP